MYLVFHWQNNKEVEIYNEILWNKSERLILDVAGFVSPLEQYFSNRFFFQRSLPVVLKYFFPL